MEYIVSARKYRPDTFESVVGQKNITTTLKNAIKNQQLAHAYLFCGPRGVGKTTCARIFAKTINCKNISADFEACNECDSCRSFNENRSYNIHELDAASNNSVEDIRSLIDKVRVPPQMGHYSVYIIDEVHMLSQAAFNAFLKTLEEPPKHAIFILATTEKHKILPTILSRCQVFDFNRITVEDAVEHLKYVAQKEEVTAEEEGLNVIAQKADGAMRDALSIFDQIVAFSGKNISYQQVIDNLNVLDYDYYFKLVDAFLKEDTTQTLLLLDDILDHGFDAGHFVAGLCSHLRDLMMCKDQNTVALLEVGASIREKYLEQAKACPVDFLVYALEIATNCDIQFRNARNKRLHTEFALIKLSRLLTEKKKVEKEAAEAAEREKSKPVTGAAGKGKPVVSGSGSGQSAKAEAPKTIKSVSIKSFTKPGNGSAAQKNEKAEQGVVEGNNGIDPSWEEPFSPERLQQVWNGYARSVENSNPRLFSMLTAHSPRLKGDRVVVFPLRNETQEVELLKEKKGLFDFLKKELRNAKLVLETEYIREESGPQKAYTSADKYKVLAEKNPTLDKLRSMLNLDIE